MGVAKKAVGLDRDHGKHWDSLGGLKQGPSANKPRQLSILKRDQLWWVVGLLTENFHLKGHLFTLGLINSPRCEQCLEKEESTIHMLCDCEAIACHLEPDNCHDSP
jgi:hypothetical protein